MKGQSSSHRKGKDVVSDPPSTHDEGEEVVYSDPDSSDEEARRLPDNECAPLIDLWYDVHSYFPKVPSDYTPLPPGHVWISLCRRNTEAPWAPLASSIPDLVIHQGTSLPVPIHFEFGSDTTLGWN